MSDSLALSRLLNACEATIVAQSHVPLDQIPPKLLRALGVLGAAVNEARPGASIRVWAEIRSEGKRK